MGGRTPAAGHFVAVDSGSSNVPPITAEDIAFSGHGASISGDHPGTYQLTDSLGKKLSIQLTAPSEIDFQKPWQVQFPDQGAPASTTFDTLTAWTDNINERIRYYSGAATYSCHFTMPATNTSAPPRWTLDLGDVRDLADVKVNGQFLATVWRPPFQVDVSSAVKAGDNLLEVTVVNSWLNRYLGDLKLPPQLRICTVGLLHSTESYTPDFPLPVSGLLGPVKIFSRPFAAISLR